MRFGILSVSVAVGLAAGGCASGPGPVKVRALVGAIDKLRPGEGLLANARAQLALGNSGLALEGFRKALRERPDSAEALTGIASCYMAMGRFDLARANYEAALALEPANREVLADLAGSLDRQGALDGANEIRREILRLAAAPEDAVEAPAPVAVPASTITVALPPARPVLAVTAAGEHAPGAGAPRLERLSLGEVALVTLQRPTRSAQLNSRRMMRAEVRWAPLASPSARPAIRLLNAARRQGLAARTRTAMLNQGWRRIEIGDAGAVRAQSLVMYPAGRAAEARKIAAKFGFRSKLVKNGKTLIVLLGRDAEARKRMPSRG